MAILNNRLNKTDMENVGFWAITNVYLMYLCEMTGAKQHIDRYMVLQCSKLIYHKVSSKFLRQDSQSSYSFGKIQNVGETELAEEKL